MTSPQDIDILWPQRNAQVALGWLMTCLFGTQTVASGFNASVSGLTVTLGGGFLTSYSAIDASAFGSLSADGGNIQNIGINRNGASFTLSAPGVGLTVGNLIEAQFVVQDTGPVVLPYYNSAGGSAFSGPGNSGNALNTVRQQTVNLQLVTNTTSPTSGWTPLYTVYATNSSGTTTLNVAQHPQAPFCPFTFPAMTPGFSRMAVFANSGTGTWTVPTGVQLGKVRCWGPGGNGGAGSSTSGNAGGGGGGGGGYIETFWSAYPQTAVSYTVGSSGTASNFGSFVTCASGGNGADSGSSGGAIGGSGGGFSLGSGQFGGYYGAVGEPGGVGYQIAGGAVGGSGGGAFGGGTGAIGSGFGSAISAANNGAGGAGGVGNEPGGAGGLGLIIVEY